MKLRIDAEACTGHGRCYVLAPEVFEPDDEGHSVGLVDDIPDTCSTRRSWPWRTAPRAPSPSPTTDRPTTITWCTRSSTRSTGVPTAPRRRVLRLRRHAHLRVLRHRAPGRAPAPPRRVAAGARALAGHRRRSRARPGRLRRGRLDPRPFVAGRDDRRDRRARPAAVQGEARRARVPRGARAGRRAPAQGPHRGAGVVGAVVPGRGDGRRPRHRARALHPVRGGRRPAHRRRSPDPTSGAWASGVRSSSSPPSRASTSARSFAYADGSEDVELLEVVGNPRPTNPTRGLERKARERGWPVHRFVGRGAPTPELAVRHVAAVGGFLTATATGIGLGLLNRSKADAVNTMISVGERPRASASPGIHLDVHRRGARVVAPTRGVPVQPPELGRPAPADGPAAARRDRGGQEGARVQPGRAARRRARRRGVHRPRRPRRVRSPPCSPLVEEALLLGQVVGGRTRGHPLGHRSPRAVQEGCVPAGDGGRRARRPDRVPQRQRRVAARHAVHAARHRRRRRPPSDPHRRLDRREPRRPHRRGARPLPRHARELADADDRRGGARRDPRPARGAGARRRRCAAAPIARSTTSPPSSTPTCARWWRRTAVPRATCSSTSPGSSTAPAYRGRIRSTPREVREAAGPQPPLPHRAAAEPPLVHRPGRPGVGAAARRPCLPRTSSAASTSRSGRWARWDDGPGLIFIRRSFRDDPVYKLALREYVGWLAEHRQNLEWYIEGGRTRTGKLRDPRLGLLAYLVDAVHDGRCDDFLLQPVSIVYDELLDVEEHARSATGARQGARVARPARELRARAADPLLARRHPRRRSRNRSRCATTSPASSPRPPTPSAPTAHRRAAAAEARVRSRGPDQHGHADHAARADHHGAALGRPRPIRRPAARRCSTRYADDVDARGLPVTCAPDRHARHRARRPCRRCSATRSSPATTAAARPCTSSSPSSASPRRTTATASSTSSCSPRSSTSRSRPTTLHDDALRLRDLFKFEFFFAEKGEFLAEVDAEAARSRPPGHRARSCAPSSRRTGPPPKHSRAHGDEPVPTPTTLSDEACGLGEQFLLQHRIYCADAVSSSYVDGRGAARRAPRPARLVGSTSPRGGPSWPTSCTRWSAGRATRRRGPRPGSWS